MILHPLDRVSHVAQTARAARIANLARASSGRDMIAHALNGVRPAIVRDLPPNVRFGLAEAVADRSSARRFFLPHTDSKILFSEDVPGSIKINDAAVAVAAEAIGSGLKASKRLLRQQCLNRQCLDSPPLRSASGA
jgi:hypothetical protein